MTIELTGPQGYEHQYRVTACVGLLVERTATELIVEPRGKEDALLRATSSDGTGTSCELQVKSEATTVDAALLAAWLLHFPEGSAEGSLIERLADDDSVSAVFAVGGRVSDLAAHLQVGLTDCPWPPPPHSSTSEALTNAVWQALDEGARALGGTPLKDERREGGLRYLKALGRPER